MLLEREIEPGDKVNDNWSQHGQLQQFLWNFAQEQINARKTSYAAHGLPNAEVKKVEVKTAKEGRRWGTRKTSGSQKPFTLRCQNLAQSSQRGAKTLHKAPNEVPKPYPRGAKTSQRGAKTLPTRCQNLTHEVPKPTNEVRKSTNEVRHDVATTPAEWQNTHLKNLARPVAPQNGRIGTWQI
jgi:hypothetical protein